MTSIDDILSSTLPLPFGQLLLNVLGKQSMLALWSLIIVVQASCLLHSDGLFIDCMQYVTGAAQCVDASRVVYAFSRDNALPGSKWWKIMNKWTQTPVNAVWLVVSCSAICGFVGFSSAALSSLAG